MIKQIYINCFKLLIICLLFKINQGRNIENIEICHKNCFWDNFSLTCDFQ
jgi:hypothetical protein